jgi:glycosyltransferase involved in cell wall biosynthesis
MLVQELIVRRSRLAKSAWIRLIEKSNVERAAAVHVTSQLELAELERFGWRLPRAVVIPNAVEEPSSRLSPIAEDVEAISAEQPLALFLGRLSWKKGLDRLLHAFARTNHGTLAIVGTDDEGLSGQLAKLAKDLRITQRVRILPRTVVGAEKERLFAAAQLFVLSSYSENFGNTVLEAMRRGVPVVVTQEVGAAEIVQQSQGGLVVVGDPDTLGSAMQRLFDDPDLVKAMGNAGRRHVATHHTWAQVAEEVEVLYESVSR